MLISSFGLSSPVDPQTMEGEFDSRTNPFPLFGEKGGTMQNHVASAAGIEDATFAPKPSNMRFANNENTADMKE